ncbi:hypothetical protein [Xanthomonas euvesicatoria]|uniref:hypothetical protein n=1 Tax=Xanthomonas euvesicatoria TaxID=456327 RepID=UPI001C486D62|nr:hypothetical protein [Xanthomonas euvesicatoria]MBV6799639.1 hypothetical protein [Xanthomonas campestris pv. obscurae]
MQENLLAPGAFAGLATFALALFKWVVSRQDAHFLRRKDVLERWQDPATMDDYKLELLSRQLVGVYLPSALIRQVCAQPKWPIVETLRELAELWPLLKWSYSDGTLGWKSAADSERKREVWNAALWVSYFGCGTFGVGLLALALLGPPPASAANHAVAVLWGLVLLFASGVSLWKLGSWGRAVKLGDAYLLQINSVVESASAPGQVDDMSSTASPSS